MSTAPLTTALTRLRREAEERSDPQLLEAYTSANDQGAFAALVRRHGPMVLAVCRRVLQDADDAEDAFQAVFLSLARGASSIRKVEALTSWLHGVAYRISLRARRDAGRRRKHESRVEPRSNPPAWEVGWRELQAILDEEVQQLASGYRAAFVLCCLEGLSKAEAAQRLGLKENTVSSQLARARKHLQKQLGRRGISLAAVLAALAVSVPGRAALPLRLVRTATEAASRLGAGSPVTGLSARVLSLADGVTTPMLSTKVKLAAVLAALCALTAGLGLFARQAPPAPATPAPARVTPQSTAGTVEVRGRVLDPDGKPARGAKVYLLDGARPKTPAPRATSAADGSFRFTFDRKSVKPPFFPENWGAVHLLATAPGYGPALVGLGKPEGTNERTLKLAKDDVPIRGRVFDLEGRPVAGARIVVEGLRVPKGNGLDDFLKELKGRIDGYPAEYNRLEVFEVPSLRDLLPSATTDSAGRFRLTGIGRERLAVLLISGEQIETRQVRVRTRPGETIRRQTWKHASGGDWLTYHGANFEHAVPPTRPVSGVVRDKATGKPIAGATVESVMLAGSRFYGHTFIRTTTDSAGRYRLVGLPRGAGNVIRVVPPEGRPYLNAEAGVPAPEAVLPVKLDFELRRGVWVEGKVIDKVTGKPVRGQVKYFVFKDNPHLRNSGHPRLAEGGLTRADGSFRFLGLPGHGLVAVRAEGDSYVVGYGLGKRKLDGFGQLADTSPPCHSRGYHGFLEMNPKMEAESLRCTVLLDPGIRLTGTVVDPDGKPLAGALAGGRQAYAFTYIDGTLPTAEFTVLGLVKGRPRTVQFIHQRRKLAGWVTLRGEEKEPVRVKLQPWGTVTGRLVTSDGFPRSKVELTVSRSGDSLSAADTGLHPTSEFFTDKDGRFRIEGLVPGLKYTLTIMRGDAIVGWVVKDLTVKPGETRNLGDVQQSNE